MPWEPIQVLKSKVLKPGESPMVSSRSAAGLLVCWPKGQGTSPSRRPKGCGAAGNAFSQGEQFPTSLP